MVLWFSLDNSQIVVLRDLGISLQQTGYFMALPHSIQQQSHPISWVELGWSWMGDLEGTPKCHRKWYWRSSQRYTFLLSHQNVAVGVAVLLEELFFRWNGKANLRHFQASDSLPCTYPKPSCISNKGFTPGQYGCLIGLPHSSFWLVPGKMRQQQTSLTSSWQFKGSYGAKGSAREAQSTPLLYPVTRDAAASNLLILLKTCKHWSCTQKWLLHWLDALLQGAVAQKKPSDYEDMSALQERGIIQHG